MAAPSIEWRRSDDRQADDDDGHQWTEDAHERCTGLVFDQEDDRVEESRLTRQGDDTIAHSRRSCDKQTPPDCIGDLGNAPRDRVRIGAARDDHKLAGLRGPADAADDLFVERRHHQARRTRTARRTSSVASRLDEAVRELQQARSAVDRAMRPRQVSFASATSSPYRSSGMPDASRSTSDAGVARLAEFDVQ